VKVEVDLEEWQKLHQAYGYVLGTLEGIRYVDYLADARMLAASAAQRAEDLYYPKVVKKDA
jgi:hypothetical protein